MLTLINTEFRKIFKTPVTKICFILLALIMLGIVTTEYQDMVVFRNNEEYRNEVMSWREREENIVKFGTESLNDDWYSNLQKEQIKRRIAIAEYRLENDIEKDIYKNIWWFFNDNMFNTISKVSIIMLIIISSVNIAGEYSGKTLRQVLLLPYKRWKILLAKLCAVSLTGLALYGMIFIIGILSGLMLHGTEGITSKVVLYFGNNITMMNMSLYSIIIILLKIVEIIFYSAITLFICVLTKSTEASMLVGGATVAFSVPISNFLASYYDIVNYIPFLNLDFRRYLDFGTTMPDIQAFFEIGVVQGITPITSIIIIVSTIVLFVGASFMIFNNQDV